MYIFNILTLRVNKVWSLHCHSLNKVKSFFAKYFKGKNGSHDQFWLGKKFIESPGYSECDCFSLKQTQTFCQLSVWSFLSGEMKNSFSQTSE